MLSIAQHWFMRRRRVDDERLLRLFSKRAELKKEFAGLRRERDRMVDLLRQQEGATMRSQQQLEHLQDYLADPVRAANACLFFQLRGVWQLCHRRLARLARDMESRQQEAEAKREQSRFDEHRQAAIAAIEQRVATLRDRQTVLDREGEGLQIRWAKLGGVWNYLGRRRLEADIGRVHAAADSVAAQIERYEAAAREKRQEAGPAPGPISAEGKRLINVLVVALAQEMILHFNEHGMAMMAREASLRSVTDTTYGSIEECRVWSQRIEAISRRFDELSDLTARIERRAQFLTRQAQYRREADTVPVAGSFETIPWRLTSDGDPQPLDGRSLRENVLADEYWDIYSVLLT